MLELCFHGSFGSPMSYPVIVRGVQYGQALFDAEVLNLESTATASLCQNLMMREYNDEQCIKYSFGLVCLNHYDTCGASCVKESHVV